MNRGILIILAGLALVLVVLEPPCFFHRFTGLHCPGCGSTRALQALFTGHPLQAAGYNLLAVLAVPLLLWVVFRRPAPDRLHPGWIAGIVAVIILFGVVRNLPWFPFDLLAP